MKSKVALLALMFASQFASAKLVVIDKQTPEIVPVDAIHQFSAIDWNKVEKRQDAGKSSDEGVTMLCLKE
jgi:hypothetical protein